MCDCVEPEANSKKGMICVGFFKGCDHPVWRKRNARYVASKALVDPFQHAVWVTHNTEPFDRSETAGMSVQKMVEHWLDTGQIRQGIATCGEQLPAVVAGENGGHDWDRIADDEKCLNCRIAMKEVS